MKNVLVFFIFTFSSYVFAVGLESYKCKFSGPLMKVNAQEWGLKILGPKGDGTACAAKIFCEWDIEHHMAPSAWSIDSPPRFEGQTACSVDKDGTCSKSFQDCNNDQTIGFDESVEKDAFRNKKLGVRPVKSFLDGGSK